MTTNLAPAARPSLVPRVAPATPVRSSTQWHLNPLAPSTASERSALAHTNTPLWPSKRTPCMWMCLGG